MNRLADSLRMHGALQAILVRPVNDSLQPGTGHRYELIAGERRWRAAKLAGLKEIPGLIKHGADDQLLELSLVENLQREDLNPIEKARAYRAMHVEGGLSHEERGLSHDAGRWRP